MKTFFDSSSFAKRFVEERGSEQVETACSEASELGLSVICVPEVVSALNRRTREESLTADQYDEAKQSLMEGVRDAVLMNLTPPVIAASLRILEANPVRAMDALHIACALEWDADRFVSSDDRQLLAAQKAGLAVLRV